jgi:hypothetical protein
MRALPPVLVLISTVACAPSPAPPASEQVAAVAPPPAARTWKPLGDWFGAGMKQTESFTTSQPEWRIVWQSKTNNPTSILQIMVYSANGRLVDIVGNVQGNAADTSYVRSTPGPHYLHISSANTTFNVVAEEQR